MKWMALQPPEYHQWWTTGDSKPLPHDFRFVLFPPTNGLPILDKPDGAPIGTLLRAVLSDPSENDLAFVPVVDGAITGFVRRDSLRWTASQNEADRMISALVAERRGRGPDYADYACTVQLPDSPTGNACVEIRMGDGSIRSKYQLSPTGGSPIEVAAWSAPGAGLEGVGGFLMSFVGIIILGAFALGVSIWVLIRR